MYETDIETLASQPLRELEHRASELAISAQRLLDDAQLSGRDINSDEQRVFRRHRDELESYRAAIALREQRDRQVGERCAAVDDAIQTRRRGNRISPLMCSASNLEILERARSEMRSLSVIEERGALTTGDMGSAVEYGPNGLAAPRSLWRASSIPTTEPPSGYSAVVPTFTLPSATSLVGEGSPHAEFDAVSPDSVTLGRSGAWSDLTSEAAISSSLTEISQAHARIISRDLDLAVVNKIEGGDSGLSVDEALTTVAAEASADTSELWIVGNPVDVAGLAGTAVFAATNAADIGSYASVYGGARIYVTPAASALTVFYPQGFRAFATRLASGVLVDPTDGSQRFGQWLIFGLGQALTGAAVTVGGGSS